MDLEMLDAVAKWLLLLLFFLFLTYVFRDRVVLESYHGYLLVLLAVIPLNQFLRNHFPAGLGTDLALPMLFLALLVVNTAVLFVMARWLPGLSVSSNGALLLFSFLFAVASFLVHHIPRIPNLQAILAS